MAAPIFEVDTETEVKMTFGLLNELCRIAGDVDAALLFNLDHDLREAALVALLSKRDAKGKITEPIEVNTISLEIDKVSDLLDWAGSHVIDFFMRGAEKAQATGLPFRDRLKVLQSSSDGGKS